MVYFSSSIESVLYRNKGIREELDVKKYNAKLGPDDLPVPDGHVNTEFLTRFLRHRHFLARAENGIADRAEKPIRAALREIQDKLKNQDKNPLSDWSLRRLDRLQEQFTGMLGVGMGKSQTSLRKDMGSLIEREHLLLARMHKDVMGVHIPLDISEPSLDEISLMVDAPLGGRRWSGRMFKNFGEGVQAMQQSLAVSMALGEGSSTAARRLRKNVQGLTVSRASDIARSEIQRVANEVALRLYQRNPEVIKGVRAVETLDGRTCPICAGLDGKLFGVRERKPEYPVHTNCRGFYAPVTSSIDDMHRAGIIDKNELPPGFAEKYDGRVPSRVDYPTWFKAQDDAFQLEILGPTRYKLFKSSKMPVTGFARDLRVLRIDELPIDAMGPLEKSGLKPQQSIPLGV